MTKIEIFGLKLKDFGSEIDEQIEINSHYRGYLKKQNADILAFKRDENLLSLIILIMINFLVYLTK